MDEIYHIRNIDEKLNPKLLPFLNEVLPFEYTEKIFSWEYDHAKKVFCYIEDANSNVVGVQGMIPIELNINSACSLTAKSETSYLDKSTQGKGLFKKLYFKTIEDSKKKGITHIWGFTSLGVVWKKLGFTVQNECLHQYTVQLRNRNFFGTSGDPNKNIIKELAKYPCLPWMLINPICLSFSNKSFAFSWLKRLSALLMSENFSPSL